MKMLDRFEEPLSEITQAVGTLHSIKPLEPDGFSSDIFTKLLFPLLAKMFCYTFVAHFPPCHSVQSDSLPSLSEKEIDPKSKTPTEVRSWELKPEKEIKLFQLKVDPIESEVEVHKDVIFWPFEALDFVLQPFKWTKNILQLKPGISI